MKAYRLYFAVILSILISPLLAADDARTPGEVKEICTAFLQMIQEGDYNKAFSYISSKPNSITDKEFSELKITTIQQSPTILSLYGKATGILPVHEEYVSDVALRLVYLVLRENLPIRWEFIYYKPGRNWKLVAISFDDLMEELF